MYITTGFVSESPPISKEIFKLDVNVNESYLKMPPLLIEHLSSRKKRKKEYVYGSCFSNQLWSQFDHFTCNCSFF